MEATVVGWRSTALAPSSGEDARLVQRNVPVEPETEQGEIDGGGADQGFVAGGLGVKVV